MIHSSSKPARVTSLSHKRFLEKEQRWEEAQEDNDQFSCLLSHQLAEGTQTNGELRKWKQSEEMKGRGMDTLKAEAETKKREAEEEAMRRRLGRLRLDTAFSKVVVVVTTHTTTTSDSTHTHGYGAYHMPGSVASTLQIPHLYIPI